MLDTQGDALTLRVDRQNNGFCFVAFLEVANGFFACFCPGDIGQVNQTVDTAFKADKDTEVSD